MAQVENKPRDTATQPAGSSAITPPESNDTQSLSLSAAYVARHPEALLGLSSVEQRPLVTEADLAEWKALPEAKRRGDC